jgi:predicted alpha/beta hydrolase
MNPPEPLEDTVTTGDGHALACRHYPAHGTVRGSIVISPAMGVDQDYYATFARWLAERGYAATTYDYRGTGRSRKAPLKGFRADLTTWTAQDYHAVLHHAKARHPALPLAVVGHSLGGQLPGLLPDPHLIDRMVTLGTGSGYWRDNAPALKRKVWFFWWFAMPLATRAFGYFPGKRLGMVGDLPTGVIRQWGRWCHHPEYCVGVEAGAREAFARVRFPVTLISFTDDELMTERGSRTLLGFYVNAPRKFLRISPADVGAKRIGHFGFFRPQFEATLWPRVLELLQQ